MFFRRLVRQIFPCSAHLTGNTNTVGSFRHQLREIGQRWLLAASAHPGQTQMVCFGVSSGTATCRLSDGDSWAKAALHWTEAEAMHLTLERIAADDWFFSNETHSCRCIHFERHCKPWGGTAAAPPDHPTVFKHSLNGQHRS